MDAIRSATTGMMSATSQLDQIAARQAAGAGDPIKDTVGEITASTSFKANLVVLKAADQMAGALLDMKA